MVEQVAPFTGAWIEIDRMSSCPFAVVVAPFTGAWIEIAQRMDYQSKEKRRTLHGCVD